MSWRLAAPLAALACAAPLAHAAAPGCPPRDEIAALVETLDLETGSRATRFGRGRPRRVIERALARPGRPVAERDGHDAFGAIVVDVPVEDLWRAVSDEEHFELDGFLPLARSDVIGGTPRGPRRLLLQTFDRFGIGRWWVSEVVVNAELYEASGGRLWEAWFEDRIADVDTGDPPVSEVADDLTPLVESHGAWLLAPLGERCTLVDYYVYSDPGGFVGAMQWLMANGAIRSTLRGLVTMAREHVGPAHAGEAFQKPDGEPLGEARPGE